jgi:thiol-disulfide isomerase/thioredoxin
MYTVESVDNLNQFIVSKKHKIIALYFGASWCGPCQKLKDQFKNDVVMKQFKSLDIVYINIDNDNLSDIVESYQIESLPTVFMTMLKDDQVVVLDKIIGYNWNRFVQSYVKNIQLLTEYLEIKNKQNNTVDNTLADNVVANNVLEDNVVANNVLEDNVVANNVLEDNVVANNVLEDNVVAANYVTDNSIQNNSVEDKNDDTEDED